MIFSRQPPANHRQYLAKKAARKKRVSTAAWGATFVLWGVFALMLLIGAVAFFSTDTIPSYGPLTKAHAQQQCLVQAQREEDISVQLLNPETNKPVEIELRHISKTFDAGEVDDIINNPVFDHRMPVTRLYGSRMNVITEEDNTPYVLTCVINMDAAEAAYDAGNVDLDPDRDIIARLD